MAGALIGLISGGALGFAANKYRESEQQKQAFKANQMKSFIDDADPSQPGYDPSIVKNDKWRKAAAKAFDSKEAADSFLLHADVHAGAYQQKKQADQKQVMNTLAQLWSGGAIGGAQSPQGAAPAGTSSPASLGTAGPPQPPASPSAPVGVSTAAPTTPSKAGPLNYDEELQHAERIKASIPMLGLSPDMGKSLSSAIDSRIKDLRQEMGSENKGQITPYQAESLALRMKSLDISADNAKANQGIREAMMGQTAELAREARDAKTDEQKNMLATAHTQALVNGRMSILEKLSDTTKFPDQQSREAATKVWNQSVDRMVKNAKSRGIDLGEADDYKIGVGPEDPNMIMPGGTPGAIGPATPSFKAGDKRTKDGVTYQRDDKGNWTPVK